MKRKKLPKYNAISTSQLQHIASKQTLRDLSGSIDVAIVGSGIGALSNAAVLSRQGFKVAVFEQNSVVGGCTHTFTKDGFTFDTGVHYVGGMSSVVKNLYDQVSDGQLKWDKIDNTYDVIYNGTTGERIEMTDDHDQNRRVLTEHFGIAAKSWKRFDRAKFCAKFWSYVVFQLKLWHPLVLRLAWPFVCLPYRRYALRSTIDVLKNECGFSSQAAGALTYHWGDHGTPPANCPFFMTALLDSHYKNGAYFPRGGSKSIAKTLVAAIERRGGHVFASSPVEQVLTMKNMFGQHSAYGVRIHGVDVLVKRFVVSDAGVLATFGIDSDVNAKHALVGDEAGAVQRSLLHKDKNVSVLEVDDGIFEVLSTKEHDNVSPCISDLSLFIGLDRSDKDLGLLAQNVWHVHDWDHDEAFQKMLNDTSADLSTADETQTPFLFISNESAKDSDWPLTHPNKSTSEVIAVVKSSLFDKWANTTHEQREKDAEYMTLKQKLTNSYLEAFYLHFPKARGHVVYTCLGTPLTMNKYLGRSHGEVYALDHNISRFDGSDVQ
eukprot:scaffold46018_cov153-Skeletonema_marinoi.AAC.1